MAREREGGREGGREGNVPEREVSGVWQAADLTTNR
jgi:hypothetical protein